MAVSVLPVDQRVIDIDSRRFASIEKALVELITNCDDSYSRLESRGADVSGKINIGYERHKHGAFLSVSDQAEGMSHERLKTVLTYGGAFSSLSKEGVGGRGYFGRGMKQAIYGLGYGWIESIASGKFSRIDLYRAETGEYLFDDWDGEREAEEKDYERLGIAIGGNGTKVGIVVENGDVVVSQFQSLKESISDNIYLRDILNRRNIGMINMNMPKASQDTEPVEHMEPKSETLIGPGEIYSFSHQRESYDFRLTLKKSIGSELLTRGDQRTNGLLVVSGEAVLDCQFFGFENQMGTEYLFGKVECDALSSMLGKGQPVISDERDGLNMKEPFVESFSNAVSEAIENAVKSEQLRLSHVERAETSHRTDELIDSVLQRMNRIAFEELGIKVPRDGEVPEKPALKFSSRFYYRKPGHRFHVTLEVEKSKLDGGSISVEANLPDGIEVEPKFGIVELKRIPDDKRIVFELRGFSPGRGTVEAKCGVQRAHCEIVLSDEASERHISKRERPHWDMDESTAIFRGYELRSLGNDMERAVYSHEERLIIINTEAPTVRLYVNGKGRFTDGARLLLAELLLDVMTDEMAHRYMDRTGHRGQESAYRKAKKDLVRRYGVEVHSILLGK